MEVGTGPCLYGGGAVRKRGPWGACLNGLEYHRPELGGCTVAFHGWVGSTLIWKVSQSASKLWKMAKMPAVSRTTFSNPVTSIGIGLQGVPLPRRSEQTSA